MYASDENYPWGQCSHGWAGLRLEVRLTCQELRLEWWGYGTPSWQKMAFQTEQLGTVPLPGTDIGPMWQKSSKGQACARSGDLVHHLHPLQLSHLWALLKWAWEPPGSGLSWDLKISVHCLPAKKTAFFPPPENGLFTIPFFTESSAHCSWVKVQRGADHQHLWWSPEAQLQFRGSCRE